MSDYERDPNVDHPRHYNVGQFETIEVVEDQNWGVGFCCGNAVKYIMRHEHKGKPIEDLKKAKWYIERLINLYETQKELKRLEEEKY